MSALSNAKASRKKNLPGPWQNEDMGEDRDDR